MVAACCGGGKRRAATVASSEIRKPYIGEQGFFLMRYNGIAPMRHVVGYVTGFEWEFGSDGARERWIDMRDALVFLSWQETPPEGAKPILERIG